MVERTLLAARTWGTWAGARREWRKAADAYRYFMTTLDYLFPAQLGREHKSSGLREAQAISAHAAYAIAELNDPKSAVTALEQSCALLLADRLERHR